MTLRDKVETDNEYFRVNIIGWEVMVNYYITDSDRCQLEYDGKIIYPPQEIKLA
jgi:hypothetical protein